MNEINYEWKDIVLNLVKENARLRARVDQLEEEKYEQQKEDVSKWVTKELQNSSQH